MSEVEEIKRRQEKRKKSYALSETHGCLPPWMKGMVKDIDRLLEMVAEFERAEEEESDNRALKALGDEY